MIANPAAGRGRARRAVDRLREALAARGHQVRVELTRGPGDAGRLAARLGSGAERIVAAGGDGTLNEVLNGLRDPGAAPLVPLALGTANMLARELRLPRDPRALARRIDEAEPCRIDLGRVGEARFCGVLGVGFDALVTRQLAGPRARRLGYRGYLRPILRAARGYRPPRLRVEPDDGPALAAGLAVVGNLRNYGGIFRLAPEARPDDGWLELCTFANASRSALLGAMAAALAGRAAALPGFARRRVRRVRIGAESPVPVQWDGDAHGATPVELRVEPGALAVLAGEGWLSRPPAPPGSPPPDRPAAPPGPAPRPRPC